MLAESTAASASQTIRYQSSMVMIFAFAAAWASLVATRPSSINIR